MEGVLGGGHAGNEWVGSSLMAWCLAGFSGPRRCQASLEFPTLKIPHFSGLIRWWQPPALSRFGEKEEHHATTHTHKLLPHSMCIFFFLAVVKFTSGRPESSLLPLHSPPGTQTSSLRTLHDAC